MTIEEKLKEIVMRTEKLIEREEMLQHMGDAKQLEILKEKLALAKALEVAYKNIGTQCGCSCAECEKPEKVKKQIEKILNGEGMK